MHIDPELDGSITGTMKLAHFCGAIGMEVQLHTAGPMHRHCMAAIPNTHFYELGLVRPDSPVNLLQQPIYTDGCGRKRRVPRFSPVRDGSPWARNGRRRGWG